MSLYSLELVRLTGDIKAYVRIQNDWSGQITEGIRNIFLKDDRYYIRVDGQEVKVNAERDRFLMNEQQIKDALKWYKETKF